MHPPLLTIHLLGAPQIQIDGRPVGPFPSSKVSGLLYALAATPRPRQRATLAALLWPDFAEGQAKKNLRGALYHLRKELDPYIDVQRQEIGLKTDAPIRIDLQDFMTELAAARTLDAHDPAQLAHLAAAMGHYRGEFLEGFGLADSDLYEEWAETERRRLHELAVQTLHRLVSTAIDSGDRLRGIDDATRLLALDPLREESRRDFMLLLALDGQSHAALAHFDEYAALIQAELGLPPGEETQALADRLRAGDFDQAVPVRAVSMTRRRHNLPEELTPILGREEETAWILNALTDPTVRHVTLAGMGGTGKTRLARHIGRRIVDDLAATAANDPEAAAAHAFADGVFFVDLAGLEHGENTDDQIAAAIAQALQFKLEDVNATQVAAALADYRLLLILDNFELLQGSGRLLTTMLEQAPQLRLLVTSRVRLNLRGERVRTLEGLPAPPADIPALSHVALAAYPAGQLFLRTAQAAGDGAVTAAEWEPEDVTAAAENCRLLQGLPLGIELAAAWAGMLSPREILAEIRQGLDFLQSDMPDLPPRHRSLRAVFARSWQHLSVAERTAMARLAIFRGGFSRDAAADVADASLLTLRRLHDKSLIRSVPPPDDAPGLMGRYEIPEILRQYALEQLAHGGEYAAARSRHSDFYLGYLAELQQELHSGDQPAAIDAIDREIDNVRMAFQWLCETNSGSDSPERMAALTLSRVRAATFALFDFYDIRGWFSEGETHLRTLLARLNTLPASVPAQADAHARQLLAAELTARHAWFTFHLGRPQESLRAAAAGLAALQTLHAEAAAIFPLNYLGAMLQHQGRPAEAEARLAEAYALAERHGDSFGASVALNTLGQVALQRGDDQAAARYCEQALDLKRQVNDRRGMTYALTSLGQIALHEGRHDAARRLFGEVLQISEALGDLRGIGLAQRSLADVAFAGGDFATAQRMYGAALTTLRTTGSRIEISRTLTQLGATQEARGQAQTAAATLHEALTIALAADAEPAIINALLAAARLLQSDAPDRSAAILQALGASTQLTPRQRDALTGAQVGLEIEVEPPAATVRPPVAAPSDLRTVAQMTLGSLARRSL